MHAAYIIYLQSDGFKIEAMILCMTPKHSAAAADLRQLGRTCHPAFELGV